MPEKLLHYQVMERLGEGARSTIYKVRDPNTRNFYALKHVVRNDPKDIRFIEQMQTEYEVSKNFIHPNLRRSYDLKIVKTMLLKVSEAFLVMELVDGKQLDQRPRGSMLEIVDSFIKTCNGLKEMHNQGFVHCDLKPNNILRNDEGSVKVIDYGQSCKIGTVKPRIQGTPDYISPEQVNRKPITVATDVFNFGATLYWVLTGKNIPTLYTVNKGGPNSFLLDARIDAPSDINPQVPPALSNLVMECVSTKATRRPQDMDEVLQRLELAKHILMKQVGPTQPASAR
jgi:serine/threonine-protein kinase